jgi:peptidoglycan/xylan/chitin deacetylase (PgdA/CDA1 family)
MQRLYYLLKPFIPRKTQIFIRKLIVLIRKNIYKDRWPIDKKSARIPEGWKGWPEGKKFALILTHDVDTMKGHNKCEDLLELEKSLGFRSSFNFVPEDYNVSPDLRRLITDNGFEVGVHGLHHDGKLYQSKKIFLRTAYKINHYLKEWNSVGFRSPSMHHNLEWIHNLNIEYDASTFDTDPFEPQSDGAGTIFPFWVKDTSSDNSYGGYVEMPYTLAQDFTLFILMKENTISIWEKKLDWIIEQGGMVLINTHPDYMNFGKGKPGFDEYPADHYKDFLTHIKQRYEGQYWHVLAREIAGFWKEHYGKENPKDGAI